VDLVTANSDWWEISRPVGKSAQEEWIEAILRFGHLSEWIPSYYFIQCIHFILPFWIQLTPSSRIALTAYCQSRP